MRQSLYCIVASPLWVTAGAEGREGGGGGGEGGGGGGAKCQES